VLGHFKDDEKVSTESASFFENVEENCLSSTYTVDDATLRLFGEEVERGHA
jgi:hypothetical protein